MSTKRRSGTFRDAATWAVLLTAAFVVVGLARRDRLRIRPPLLPGQEALPLPRPPGPPEAILRSQAEMERTALDMRSAGEAADRARRELEQVRADIQKRQDELRNLKDSADRQASRTKQELEEARTQLGTQRDDLERTAAAAERRVRAARAEMVRLEAERIRLMGQAGIARGLEQDRRRFVPNAAAVAAAGAVGRSSRRGRDGEGPGTFGVTTLEGDLLRGEAELARAQADLAVDMSIAAINQQTTRALALENRMRGVENFFQARRINQESRARESGPAVTMSEAVRISAMQLPPRPTALQLDPATGEISWPNVLRDGEYRDLTEDIQRRFSERCAAGGSVGVEQRQLLFGAVDDLANRLRANVSRHPPGEYGAAQSLLSGLRREYGMPLND